jgi:putative transposase
LNARPLRQSLRLPGYDYASGGAYFVTICAEGRACRFGDVESEVMTANVAGLMVESWWNNLTIKFPAIALDAFVVMPNHVHGILLLNAIGHGSPPQPETGGPAAPLHPEPHPFVGLSPALGEVVRWFKTMTTNDYIRGVREFNLPRFDEKLWQRNYYEHIIRNDASLERIRAYIEANPSRWSEDTEHPANAEPVKEPAPRE